MVKKIKEFLFKNKDAKQTVAKNTVWLTISNYGGRLIKAAIVIYGARALDTAGYGVFSYALTLAGFVSLFLDPGINSILVRDAAKATEEERMKVFSTTFVVKLVLVAIGVLAVIFIAPSFSTLPGAPALLPLVALILSFDTFRNFFASLMDAREKMEWDAITSLIENVAITVLGFWFLAVSPTPMSFTLAYAIGAGIGALAALIVVLPYLLKSLSRFSARFIMPVLNSAWPFAVIGALGVLLTNTDILIISWMRSAAEVGIYSAVIRIVQVIYIVPGIIQTATLPAFSRLAKNNDARFRAAFERTLGFIFLASVPLALGGLILGAQVMALSSARRTPREASRSKCHGEHDVRLPGIRDRGGGVRVQPSKRAYRLVGDRGSGERGLRPVPYSPVRHHGVRLRHARRPDPFELVPLAHDEQDQSVQRRAASRQGRRRGRFMAAATILLFIAHAKSS